MSATSFSVHWLGGFDFQGSPPAQASVAMIKNATPPINFFRIEFSFGMPRNPRMDFRRLRRVPPKPNCS
jgi:hypothetical protein